MKFETHFLNKSHQLKYQANLCTLAWGIISKIEMKMADLWPIFNSLCFLVKVTYIMSWRAVIDVNTFGESDPRRVGLELGLFGR